MNIIITNLDRTTMNTIDILIEWNKMHIYIKLFFITIMMNIIIFIIIWLNELSF